MQETKFTVLDETIHRQNFTKVWRNMGSTFSYTVLSDVEKHFIVKYLIINSKFLCINDTTLYIIRSLQSNLHQTKRKILRNNGMMVVADNEVLYKFIAISRPRKEISCFLKWREKPHSISTNCIWSNKLQETVQYK